MRAFNSEAAVLFFCLEIKDPECFYLNRGKSQHTYRWSQQSLQKRDSNLLKSAKIEAGQQSPLSGLGITW